MKLSHRYICIYSFILFFINFCRSEYSSNFHFPNEKEEIIDGFFSKSRHTNNWAVLVN